MPSLMTEFLSDVPEVFFSTTATSRAAGGAVRAGRARRIARGLYTRNVEEPLDAVVRRNWAIVAAGLYPGAVVVDRTAFEAAPAADGSVCLDGGPDVSRRAHHLPGLTLRVRSGPGPLDGDSPFMGDLFLSGRVRAFLDNLKTSRSVAEHVRRTLSREEIEARLDQLAARQGSEALNRLRDEARSLAPALAAEREYALLTDLIGALLGTGGARLRTPLARARRTGVPYDDNRVALFEALRTALLAEAPPIRPERPDPANVFAFFEAYFSNFIEGTEFTVDEAKQIVFDGKIPRTRSRDAHDVLGTFQLVSDPDRRPRVPISADDFLTVLRDGHRLILAARPDMQPGEFKEEPNRAGLTYFVAPELVRGTLLQGYQRYLALPAGFPRAVFMMFLVGEVHPFNDGNGRIARAMMNAELSAVHEQRVLVPIVYRDNYLQALRALSGNDRPEALIRTIDFAQRYSGEVDCSSIERALPILERTGAFLEPSEAEASGRRLQLPHAA